MRRTKELTSRQKQAIESKNRLIKAAVDLFNEYGFDETTVQDICARAGLSVGVFYHYFPSKRDALQAVLGEKTEELMHFIDTESVSQNHIEAILEVFGFICRQQTEGPFDWVCNTFAPTRNRHIERDIRLRDFVYDIIESAQETGELTTDFPRDVIAEDLLNSARGFVFYWCEEGGNFDVVAEQRAYLSRILRAYLGPEGKV